VERQHRILVAGARGLVGSAIVRRLREQGYANLLTPSRGELDYLNADSVDDWFAAHKPEYLFMAAARVGGILANSTYPVEFLRDNLVVQTNLLDSAWRHRLAKVLFLGSSCIYPRLAPQPIREEYLMSGPLEPTNEAYAIAKIAGIRLAQAYSREFGMRTVSLMPTNLYGPRDNFDLLDSHVLPALLRRFHEAKVSRSPEVVVWGTGTPRREFLHVDDLAAAAVLLMERRENPDIINVGAGTDLTIGELAEMIASVVGYQGQIRFDTSKPDGMPRKLLDSSRLRELGWVPRIGLREGIQRTYDWYQQEVSNSAR